MKISKQQKLENRRKIIESAVDLVIEKDLKSATMREISRHAGIADATIYNYFPTKEAIVYGYYEDRFDHLIDQIKAIDEFHTFSFQEQLQTVFETKLELFTADREFLQKTFKMTFFTLSQHYARIKPIKAKFVAIMDDLFESAIEVEEIPEQVFRELIIQFFWEYYIGVVIYWLNDRSDRFEETTVLIDKTMDLACSSIKAGIGNKIFDIGIFLFKNHILGRMELIKDHVDTIHGIKKKFMEGR
ncbi:MAG: TetR/AcrR family transcriptional regulator [Desulfobacteraceae bacterium]|nr:MAG: TetR/AcrR family transcriptional regulator [Desulfobacteraceae bacterium]